MGLDFISLLSESLIDVGYTFSILDHNIKLHLFDDDQIEYWISYKKQEFAHSKVCLSEYAAYQITKKMPPISDTEIITYRIKLKLVKPGDSRKQYEKKCILDMDNYARETILSLHQEFCSWKDQPKLEENYPARFETLLDRMALWGHRPQTEEELKMYLHNITPSDFGIKDIVKLSYLPDLFFKDDLPNDKLFTQLNTVMSARKNFYEALCKKIKSLK